MHNHFDKNLCVRDIILSYRPNVLLECGAGSGENTRQILSLLDIYQFKLFTVSDSPYSEDTIKLDRKYSKDNFEWLYDISYIAMKKFKDDSIGFCSIDTDHNYWTLYQELESLHPKLINGGVIVMHDTETYKKNSGRADRYGTSDPYPGNEIISHELKGLGMGDAIEEFLEDHKGYRIVKQTSESHGAMLLEKD